MKQKRAPDSESECYMVQMKVKWAQISFLDVVGPQINVEVREYGYTEDENEYCEIKCPNCGKSVTDYSELMAIDKWNEWAN